MALSIQKRSEIWRSLLSLTWKTHHFQCLSFFSPAVLYMHLATPLALVIPQHITQICYLKDKKDLGALMCISNVFHNWITFGSLVYSFTTRCIPRSLEMLFLVCKHSISLIYWSLHQTVWALDFMATALPLVLLLIQTSKSRQLAINYSWRWCPAFPSDSAIWSWERAPVPSLCSVFCCHHVAISIPVKIHNKTSCSFCTLCKGEAP